LLLWKDVYVGEGEGGFATLSSQESSPPGGVKEKSRDSSAEEQEHKCQVTHAGVLPPPSWGVKDKSRDSSAEEQEHKCQVTHAGVLPTWGSQG
jgi:hypothetical protein